MELNWRSLPFAYHKTKYNVRYYYRNNKWSEMEISDSEYLTIHIAATALHYSQQIFEGLKAYRGVDNKVRLFRWQDNAERLNHSAKGLFMPELPKELFYEAIKKVIELNIEYVPPANTGATLYIRPLMIGIGPQVGIKPSAEYMFIVFVTPVGPYFKEGFKPVKIAIVRDSDRAAPLGTGTFKTGGNYASSLRGLNRANLEGFSSAMYLDPKEKKYIDEIGAANFFGIKNNTYITPKSTSILDSITNRSLMKLAEDMNMKVERRPVPVEELETFEEVGACGTAAVITPIGYIKDLDTGKEYFFCKDGKPGPISEKLYKTLTGIQFGELEDKFGWTEVIC